MRSVILLAILLAGCSNAETLPQPKGAVFQLNTGRWIPQASDLHPQAGSGT